jgi:hypothetical protein
MAENKPTPKDPSQGPTTPTRDLEAEAEAEREKLDHDLDDALDMSFPASDPISIGSHDR